MAELALGEPIEPWVLRRRDNGQSWQQIVDEISDETQGLVRINRETLRMWFRESVAS